MKTMKEVANCIRNALILDASCANIKICLWIKVVHKGVEQYQKHYILPYKYIVNGDWYFKITTEETENCLTIQDMLNIIATESREDCWDDDIYVSRFESCTSGDIYFCRDMVQSKEEDKWDKPLLVFYVEDMTKTGHKVIFNLELAELDVKL